MTDGWVTVWQWVLQLWQVALKHKDAIGMVLTFGALVVTILAWLFPNFGHRFRKSPRDPLPSELAPFEKIAPQSDHVLWRLLGNQSATAPSDDPLADYNIPHQARVAGRNIPLDIIGHMEHPETPDQSWVLVLGRSGLGKSREAAQVAMTLNQEGWTGRS